MDQKNIDILLKGGVGIIPTDTVYGIACSVFSKQALIRLYELKGRDEDKPPVVIISELSDLEKFGIKISLNQSVFIKKYWPGQVTIIFRLSKDYSYLDKGKGLAIRLPANEKIRAFLRLTGPLATSSANLQGQPLAKNISEARKYFGDKVDFYEDWGQLESLPSTLVDLKDDEIKVLRQGGVNIS